MKRALPAFGNLDQSDPKRAQVEQVFKDMTTVVNAVLAAGEGVFDSILTQYFDQSMSGAVKNVLQNMVQPAQFDASTGADRLAAIVFNGQDFKNGCGTAAAYAVNQYTASQIHFCDTTNQNAYAFPSLAQVTCDKLDPVVSWKMSTLGGYILVHELTYVQLCFLFKILSRTAHPAYLR